MFPLQTNGRDVTCDIDIPNMLNHLSLASFLWNIGKQHIPRWDAAFWGYSVCTEKVHRKMT